MLLYTSMTHVLFVQLWVFRAKQTIKLCQVRQNIVWIGAWWQIYILQIF